MGNNPQLAKGQRVLLVDLQSSPHYNGLLMEVVDYKTDTDRYQVRPLGKEAQQRILPSITLAVKRSNLTTTSASAFWHRLNYQDKDHTIPLECQTDTDGYGGTGIRLHYSLFAGEEAVKPALDAFVGEVETLEDIKEAIAEVPFGIVTSPIADERARRGLKKKEVLIIAKKEQQLLDSMLDYELVEQIDKTAEVGYYGALPLYQILFPME